MADPPPTWDTPKHFPIIRCAAISCAGVGTAGGRQPAIDGLVTASTEFGPLENGTPLIVPKTAEKPQVNED
jgi:hypothetical protein